MSTEEKEEIIVDGVHNYSSEDGYHVPEDPKVRENLEKFRDRKLGLFMHWGLYSEIGAMESWCLVDQEKEWSQGDFTWDTLDECKRQYTELNRSFNPIRFEPKKWAKMAKDCGFKYFILTTKHHEGFCLWDTKETDYKTTGKDCPFHTHKYANIIKHAFDAFREEDISCTAYFSKADWHSPYYWSPDFRKGEETIRDMNYNPKEHPELWEKFVQFTQNQILELVNTCGPLDGLWFDAGQVNKAGGQDIRMEEIAEKARKVSPGILMVDRTAGTEYENYLTPEGMTPDHAILVPWESCITLDHGWGWKYEHNYKTPRTIIHLLIDIVAKGGSLALDVGPQPDGRIAIEAQNILLEMGRWLKHSGDAIYGTRVFAPYFNGKWSYSCKDETVFAIYRTDENEKIESLSIPLDINVSKIELVANGETVDFKVADNEIKLNFTKTQLENLTDYAVAFKITH